MALIKLDNGEVIVFFTTAKLKEYLVSADEDCGFVCTDMASALSIISN